MTSHQPSPLRNWGIALVFHHSSNDSELAVDEMYHSSPVTPPEVHYKLRNVLTKGERSRRHESSWGV